MMLWIERYWLEVEKTRRTKNNASNGHLRAIAKFTASIMKNNIERGYLFMFTKRYDFNIKKSQVVTFVRLLGEYGLKFRMGKEFYDINFKDDPKYRYRRFNVYATRWQMIKLLNAVRVLRLVNCNLY